MAASIPIFVISYNRGRYLERVIDSYRRLAGCGRIIVHDNGSDDPLTLDLLEHYRKSGDARVVHSPKVLEADDLNGVKDTVDSYLSRHPEISRYAVTDCDIDMSCAAGDALLVYDELLARFPDIPCVGPMLTIRDIPRDYPLYNEVMNRHVEQFWHRDPEWIATSRGRVAFLPAEFDTTFALYRSGPPFRRLQIGIRVYFPYEARHLDWYERDGCPGYAATSSSNISHWGNGPFGETHREAALRVTELTYVERGGDELVARRMVLPCR